MALVAIAIALPAALLLGGGDDDEQDDLPPITLSETNEFNAKRLGVSGSAPEGWSASAEPNLVAIRSQSGYGRLIVTSPGSASEAGRIFRGAIAALEVSFPKVEAGPTLREAQIGGHPTRSSFVALKRPDGREVQAAIAVAEGEERAYLIELFIDEGAAPRRFGEAEAIIGSLELAG